METYDGVNTDIVGLEDGDPFYKKIYNGNKEKRFFNFEYHLKVLE